MKRAPASSAKLEEKMSRWSSNLEIHPIRMEVKAKEMAIKDWTRLKVYMESSLETILMLAELR